MASGVPAVAPDAGGPRDLVVPGRTGYLLAPQDPEVFAAQLRRSVEALRDPVLRARFGAAARESVAQRTWPALCEQLIGHYAEVIGGAGVDRLAA